MSVTGWQLFELVLEGFVFGCLLTASICSLLADREDGRRRRRR